MKHAGIVLLFLAVLSMMSTATFADIITQKDIKLLAVSQDNQGTLRGGVADLNLEVRQGSGRIFIDTYPLTKIDTQISARLAKEIACSYANVDCSIYDFIYTIRSSAPTIGGPSAGAAISGVTIAALLDLEIDQNVAITGTIGSGGLVGHVGGVQAKVEAASQHGLKKVLIPLGQRFVQNASQVHIKSKNATENQSHTTQNTTVNASQYNATIDVIQIGEQNNVDVIEVATIDDVLKQLTGYSIGINQSQVEVPQYYEQTMLGLSQDLCNRAEQKRVAGVPFLDVTNQTNTTVIVQRAQNLLNNSKIALEAQQSYAAASYCFGAALQYNYLYWLGQDKSTREQQIATIQQQIQDFKRPSITTITALQAAMLVEERLVEAQDLIQQAQQSFIQNNSLDTAYQIAFAQERLNSAKSWSTFFDIQTEELSLDENILRNGCELRISEAEQRKQYVSIYLPSALEVNEEEIQNAYEYQQQGNDVMCIFFASKAKAYYDVLVSSLGSSDTGLEQQLNARFNVAQFNIQKQLANGVFPIGAYSYAEYGKSLAQSDIFSALLYLQYAIELSDIGIYLTPSQPNSLVVVAQEETIWQKPKQTFLMGIVIGLSVALLFFRLERWFIFHKTKSRSHKNKKMYTPGKK